MVDAPATAIGSLKLLPRRVFANPGTGKEVVGGRCTTQKAPEDPGLFEGFSGRAQFNVSMERSVRNRL